MSMIKYPIPQEHWTPGGYEFLQSTGQTRHPGKDCNSGRGNSDLGTPAAFCDFGKTFLTNRSTAPGYGNQVILEHENGKYYSRYAHLLSFEVKVGQLVSPFESKIKLGKSGTSSAHLHFELMTPELVAFAKTQKRDWWNFYPVGRSIAWVKKYYLDPDKSLTMFTLIKGDQSPEVYAVDHLGECHLIVNEEQFNEGVRLNMWGSWTSIMTRPEEEVAVMKKGHPIVFGL